MTLPISDFGYFKRAESNSTWFFNSPKLNSVIDTVTIIVCIYTFILLIKHEYGVFSVHRKCLKYHSHFRNYIKILPRG